MTQHYDVVINGAGMVGSVAALLFAEQGFNVCLIETQKHTSMPEQGNRQLRVSAISNHNLKLLTRLGITRHWQGNRPAYYRHMRVWDNHSTGVIEFHSDSDQVLGAMVENNVTIAAAQQQLDLHPNITVMYEKAIKSFEQSDRKVHIRTTDQMNLQCSLLVGADGARSQIRTDLGIQVRSKSYQQHGLVCYLEIEKAPKFTALQSFNLGGPVGLLPMNDGLFSVVWSLPEDQVEYWLSTDKSRFINGLKAHINRDLGEIKLSSDRAAFPLYKNHADRYYLGRVVLIGDAAHTIHPLAGQGVNLGFGDAEGLIKKITDANLKNDQDVSYALKKFTRIRMAEVRKTSETMDALHHIFSNQSAPIKMLRAFGMNRLNQIKPIKQWLLSQAGS